MTSLHPRRRPVSLARLLIVALVWVGVMATAGGIAQAEGESVKGTLESVSDDGRTPIGQVRIVVSLGGAAVGEAVSAADGTWEIPVPGADIYRVELDVASLPEGVDLTDADRAVLPEVQVRDGQNKTVRFNLGPGLSASVGDLERFADLVVVGLKLGAIIALAAVGLSLIFGVTGLVNFAHGEFVTLGAVFAYWLHADAGGPQWPLILAAVPAVLLTAGTGAINELGLWRPLRRRRTGAIAMMVVSIGLAFAVRNTILVFFSGEPRTYRDFVIQDGVNVLGLSIPPKNLVIIATALLCLGGVGIFLLRSKTGVAMRAVADNSDLAESSGIDVERVILVTWIMGAGLAGLGGVFLGVSESVQWDMGFKLLLLIFAAVVLGGLGTAFGAMLGGFIVGLSVEVSTFWIDTELKNAIALGVLVLMLLVRPQGLLGRRERIG
jgi:neutral amino acid transport system permease protein